jgi:hypothetical protein
MVILFVEKKNQELRCRDGWPSLSIVRVFGPGSKLDFDLRNWQVWQVIFRVTRYMRWSNPIRVVWIGAGQTTRAALNAVCKDSGNL